MNHQIAADREGHTWVILSIGNTLKVHRLSGTAPVAVMDLAELVDMYGPLILSPTHPAVADEFASIIDTVDLVASDPETASVEQIRIVASVLRGILDRHTSATASER
ncbi:MULTISPECIES: hypothetical protein [unclassified Rhodococcus (in: high G+C Gram-positive bacteria)]|jgi:hypothetical protein|uniref:hypothetical protein n=1 Tax=unclassified Rhodococcus (in: high G+C Gram-positive bacteria) TaxID=192944 RepID=UPI00096AB68E|nr:MULTISPECIES: hypothetical protein [unclassified Rhodococcus (in: high G+C Gram-positive bacteria)]